MATETVDRVYCSYSGTDISMDVNIGIHIWETFVPKEKVQEELDFLEEKGFDLNQVEVDEWYFSTTPYWESVGVNQNHLTHVHLETTVDNDSHYSIEDFLHARGWKHDEEEGSTL